MNADGTNPFGTIFVSHHAIATIACQAALSSYGIVGLAAKNFAEGLAHALVKDPSMGVDIQYDGKKIVINLYVIVEYGTRIQTVTSSMAETVRYQVEKAMSVPVDEVNVHVRGLRISNVD